MKEFKLDGSQSGFLCAQESQTVWATPIYIVQRLRVAIKEPFALTFMWSRSNLLNKHYISYLAKLRRSQQIIQIFYSICYCPTAGTNWFHFGGCIYNTLVLEEITFDRKIENGNFHQVGGFENEFTLQENQMSMSFSNLSLQIQHLRSVLSTSSMFMQRHIVRIIERLQRL